MSASPGPAGRRVLVVEDELLLRDFLAQLLVNAGYTVNACSTAEEAVIAFATFDPDALLTDIDLGGGATGIDLAMSLARRAPYLRVIFLTSYRIPPNYRGSAIAGATYVNKADITGTTELLGIVDAAFRGKSTRAVADKTAAGALAALTPSQASVLQLIAAGASNEEIAAKRGSTVGAVEHMISRIFTALGLTTDTGTNMRVAAARLYYEAAGPAPLSQRSGSSPIEPPASGSPVSNPREPGSSVPEQPPVPDAQVPDSPVTDSAVAGPAPVKSLEA